MLESVLKTIFTEGVITTGGFFAATLTSVLCGLWIAFLYKLKNRPSQSFLITLVAIPAIVQVVIMLVNGNVGTGVAVAGAFSLVRFRSATGKGQEITNIFLVMAVGLATGMGYLGIAILFTLIISVLTLVLQCVQLGKGSDEERILKIYVPENLDFEDKFNDIFSKYLDSCEMNDVKTASMGSLYKLSYTIRMKKGVSVKEMMDELRTRNGNLEISVSRPMESMEEL